MAVFLLALVGCVGWETWEEADLRWATQTRDTRTGGAVRVRFDVAEGETAFLLTSKVEWPQRAFVVDLVGPGGDRLYDAQTIWDEGAHSWTGAIAPEWATTLNWPVLDAHEPLQAGRYEVRVAVVDLENYYLRNAAVESTVAFRGPVGAAPRRLVANLVLVDDLITDAATRSALDAALVHWRRIYANAGIELDLLWSDYRGGPLAAAGEGDREAYESIAASSPANAVNVVFVELIDGNADLYGLAGHIPGPLVPSIHSAVTISTLVNAGTDGRFDDGELRLFGETIAHEVAHQLGLFHPVETSWTAWDALDDTPECGTQSTCMTRLGNNLMFPFPLCEDDGCAPQSELSPQQIRVANRYVAAQ